MVLTSLEVVVEPCVYCGIYCTVTEGNVGGGVLECLVPGRQLQTEDKSLTLTLTFTLNNFLKVTVYT